MSIFHHNTRVPVTPDMAALMADKDYLDPAVYVHALKAEAEISYYVHVLGHTITHDNGAIVTLDAPLFATRVVNRQL